MVATIDISIFSSPTKALGNVTGDIEVPDSIHVGDRIRVLPSKKGSPFSGELKVISVVSRQGFSGRLLLRLEDIVFDSVEEARELAARFENEAGLFFDQYE